MPNEVTREERDAEDKPIRRCDSTTFSQRIGRVYWLKPHNFWEWIFGRKTTYWQCAKCYEQFKKKPAGQCQSVIIAPAFNPALDPMRA